MRREVSADIRAAITALAGRVEANRGFNYQIGKIYQVIGLTKVEDKDKVIALIENNDGTSFEKAIDPRNLLPFGLKGEQVASNSLRGEKVSSLSEILEVAMSGFRVEFTSKADGFGKEVKDGMQVPSNPIIWGGRTYNRRESGVQLVDMIPV